VTHGDTPSIGTFFKNVIGGVSWLARKTRMQKKTQSTARQLTSNVHLQALLQSQSVCQEYVQNHNLQCTSMAQHIAQHDNSCDDTANTQQ
jgi:hypothetical protein